MVFVDGRFDRFETPWGYVRDGAGQFHAYIRDYQGSVVGVVNTAVSTRPLTQFTDYYPYGLPHDDATGVSVNRRKFGGKEYMTESGLNELDFGARHMLPQYGLFTSPDPKAIENTPFSPWAYCNGDPVNNIDPTGMAVIYRLNGDYIGHTSEGFTGDILIYKGPESDELDFSKLTQGEAFEKYSFDLFTFDSMRGSCPEPLSGDAMSKVWTHVISHFEGERIYDEIFSMSKIPGGVIKFDHAGTYSKGNKRASWVTQIDKEDGSFGGIVGTGLYEYETTVENIASSVIVHEWYSHGMKGATGKLKSHRLAYKNVINFRALWNGTTPAFKSHALNGLRKYTLKETGRDKVDPLYRRLFKNYAE